MSSISWLGVAGLKIEVNDRYILIDPYLSRHSKFETLFAPILPKRRPIEEFARAHKNIEAIFVSHTHSDHAADIPKLAELTGAKICGSKSLGVILQTFGVEKNFWNLEEMPEVSGNGWKVTAIVSKHGKALFGREPFPGEITKFPKKPRVFHYRTGKALNFLIEVEDKRILHFGSAELDETNLAKVINKPIDIVFFCVPGWNKEKALERLLKAVRPKVLIPFHHDDFSSPLNPNEVKTIPGVDLKAFISSAKKLAPETRLVNIKPLEVINTSRLTE